MVKIGIPLQVPLTGFILVLGYGAMEYGSKFIRRPCALANTGPPFDMSAALFDSFDVLLHPVGAFLLHLVGDMTVAL